MAIALVPLKKSGIESCDLLIMVKNRQQLNHHKELSGHITLLTEKLKAEKSELITFYQGSRKIVVGMFFNKDKDRSYKLENIRAFGNRIGKQFNALKSSEIAIVGL
ncbi:MAG TPA: hypothetical protein PK637_18350, partial [Flavobacteriales bacterium]|nr:hypothetical protein [Flavobacteriales bacterium]